MTKFLVKVRQVRTVDIEVEAPSMVAARQKIEEYGPDLAMVDYDNVGEYPQKCRIVSVQPHSQ